MFECIRADLKRHLRCDQRDTDSILWTLFVIVFAYGFQASTVYRFGCYIDRKLTSMALLPIRMLANVFYLLGKFLTEKMYGIKINRNAKIDKGLYIGHFGGIEIENCTIGKNCNVHQHVKIGKDAFLGDNIWIGAHAILDKGVSIADGATIMVGAKVLNSVEFHCLASGNPARTVKTNFDNRGLLSIDDS